MGRYFKVLKGGIPWIKKIATVDACVEFAYIDKSCCYQKDVSMKSYVLKYEQFIYGISFILVRKQ